MEKSIIGITTDIKEENLLVKHHYPDAIVKAGGIPFLLPLIDDAKSYAEKIHGLLIPGGADIDPWYYHEEMMPQVKPVARMRSDFEVCLLKEMVRLQKPVLGICYGMQLINVAFGGTLYQDIKTQLSVDINHKKDYHIIVITENSFLKEGTFSVNSTHHQAIKKLGADLVAFACAPDNLIEAFYMRGYPFLVGAQWHPERMYSSDLSFEVFESFIKASNV